MRDAASATPCAWFPAEDVITPRPRTSAGSLAIWVVVCVSVLWAYVCCVCACVYVCVTRVYVYVCVCVRGVCVCVE